MTKSFQQKNDPNFKREQEKYEEPVPSREWILSGLNEIGRLASKKKLFSWFKIAGEQQQEAMRRRLNAMVRDGQLFQDRRGRYGIAKGMTVYVGTVVGRRDGYGQVKSEDPAAEPEEPIYLAPRQMRSLFPGDRIKVRPGRTNIRGRMMGEIIEVLARNTKAIVGCYTEEQGVGLVIPVDRTITQAITLVSHGKNKARPGDYVEVVIETQPQEHQRSVGRIVQVLGDRCTVGIEADVMARAFELPDHWTQEVDAELRHLGKTLSQDDKLSREDITSLPLVTIDGEDAKDFDDAVFCEPVDAGKGWRLVVAIADVSHYVLPGSALDQEAKNRGNSVYFPQRVIPMLPEKLSNHLCSLKPDVERLAMVCDMQITRKGQLRDYRFYPATIRSHARLTYTQVTQMIDGLLPTPKRLQAPLSHLQSLFEVLFVAREQRGALDFDSAESRVVIDDQGQISDIVTSERTIAHRIIEECMLMANVAAASFLSDHAYPALYRVHEGPELEKLVDLRAFLKAFHLTLGGRTKPKSKDYAKLLEQCREREDAAMLQTVILRSLKQALYSTENKGHFGLAYEKYTHFTSPIRRYPDLLVHRAIKQILQKNHPDKSMMKMLMAESIQSGEHCSMTERRADLAVREAMSWLKCRYMEDRIGEQGIGIVTGVMSFGLFIALEPSGIEGLVHISQLDNDYYDFDAVHHVLRGSRSGKLYRLGDRVKVMVEAVNVEERQIDFRLIK